MPVLQLHFNVTSPRFESSHSHRGSPCVEVLNAVAEKKYSHSRIVIVMLGVSSCDVEKTSVLLKRMYNQIQVEFWKITPCFNCTLALNTYEDIGNTSIYMAAVPFVTAVRPTLDMNAAHALATHIAGVPVHLNLRGLYRRIGKSDEIQSRNEILITSDLIRARPSELVRVPASDLVRAKSDLVRTVPRLVLGVQKRIQKI
ncbi:hypothetical protein Y032_0048g1674 [Ancylostoma ceylanicum]|uniref:Uncharacterized protein n=1 Tax=Ancylostoma ceylanicum TaxID=53326 RepID=A0A016UAN2_9BILA|nr:hypothetical protein Y032_0048g1674 [Ancylostoma ceylanicum]